MRLDLRMDCRAKLERLAAAYECDGRPLSLTAMIERLICEAVEPEVLSGRSR